MIHFIISATEKMTCLITCPSLLAGLGKVLGRLPWKKRHQQSNNFNLIYYSCETERLKQAGRQSIIVEAGREFTLDRLPGYTHSHSLFPSHTQLGGMGVEVGGNLEPPIKLMCSQAPESIPANLKHFKMCKWRTDPSTHLWKTWWSPHPYS